MNITSGLSGTISNTGYPTTNYTTADNCTWTFNFADGAGRLLFTFDSHFAVAPNLDYFVVYDSLNGTDDSLLAKWSGIFAPDPLLTSAPVSLIKMQPNVGNYVGFSFTWQRVTTQEVGSAAGGSVNMAGSVDTMGCPGSPTNWKLEVNGSLTLEAWIKPSDLSASNFWYRVVHYRSVLNKYVLAMNGGLTGAGMSQRAIVFGKCDDSTGYATQCARVFSTNQDTIRNGVWQHLAVVWNASIPANATVPATCCDTCQCRWTAYINGVQQAYTEVTSNVFGDPTFPPNQLGIASNPGSTVGAYKGSIDDLRIWNVALSKADITSRMSGGLLGNETGLVAWFKFDEPGSALYLNDSSTTIPPPLQQCVLGYGTGNTVPHRTLSTFPLTAVCGNGFVENGEACDDGNLINGDCCSADCMTPAAAFTVCRASAGPCDIVEYCVITGSLAGSCPTNAFNSTYICRPSQGNNQCDPQEVCNGTSAFCPADVIYAAGTACSDSNACTYTDKCQAGTYACTGTSLSPVCGSNAFCKEQTYAVSTCNCTWGYVGDGYTCAVATCPAIASTATVTSACTSGTTAIGGTCFESCAGGYTGGNATLTCVQSGPGVAATWSGSAPTCTATSCAALAAGGSYTSTCASSTTAVGATCQRACATGYAGTAVTSACYQMYAGAVAGFDTTTAPFCSATSCAQISNTVSYTTTCSSATTNVNSGCTLSCAAGYAGTAISRTCVQATVGATANWDSSATPTCNPTSCAAIASGATYTSSCSSTTTAYGANCQLSCASGYSGACVTLPCQQSTVGAPATFVSTSPPSCTATSCAALASGGLYTSSCTSGASVGATCTRACNSGYAGTNTTHHCVQTFPGATASYDSSSTPTCTVTQCAGVADGSTYTTTCHSATNVGTSCTLSCATGYTGTSLTRMCGQSPAGVAAGWDSSALPSCNVATCAAIPSGATYNSGCASGTTGYGGTCVISCASGYAGTTVTRTCTQVSTGAAGTFDSTSPPTCTATTCAALPNAASYDSTCASTTTAVGGTCARTCHHGYAGSGVSDTCVQATVGAAATFSPNTAPTCTATTCSAIAAGSTYTSTCGSSTTAVDATCTLACGSGYSGTAVTHTCQQTTTGGAAAFDSTSAPTCGGAVCPIIVSGATYASQCASSTTALGATCTLSCASGYQGSAVTHTCTQSGGAGTDGVFDSTAAPSCTATQCASLASAGDGSYLSSCASSPTSVAGTCTLSCGSGYTGTSVSHTCQQASVGAAAAFDSTAAPSCVAATCPALPDSSPYFSSCSGGTTPLGGTCRFTCAATYAGANVTHTCQQSSAGASGAWDSTSAPSCSVSSCASIASGTGYDSACASSTTGVGSNCAIQCASGYAGTAVTHHCQQTVAGAAATFDSTAAPSCAITTCASLASDVTYSSTCASGTTSVGGTCVRACRSGYAGTSVTHTCGQTSTGAAAAFDTTATPSCTATSCAAIASTASFDSACSSGTTSVSGQCTLSCTSGNAGTAVTRTCQQASVGAAAAWDSSSVPSCAATSCAAIASGSGFTSACASGTTAYGATCVLSCASGYSGSAVTHTCTQSSAGASATFDSTSPPTCTATSCGILSESASYSSSCSSGTTAVGGSCTRQCKQGYAGTTVFANCQQSSVGAVASFDSTTPPTCTVTKCAGVPDTSSYTTTCNAATSVSVTCSLVCASGYEGTALSRTCVQPSAGAAALWSLTSTPSCTPTTCDPIAADATYTSSCASGTTNVGDSCTLACISGFGGGTVVRTCEQGTIGGPADWTGGAFTCSPLSCVPIPGDASLTTDCGSGSFSIGDVCHLSCGSGYTGTATSRTCTLDSGSNTAAWGGANPACSVTSCASVPGTVSMSSTCATGLYAFGVSCTVDCRSGYVGTSMTAECTQSAAGAAGAWSATLSTTCVAATCPVVASGARYTSSCASSVTPVNAACLLACNPGTVGATVAPTCVGMNTWDSTAPPTCDDCLTCAPDEYESIPCSTTTQPVCTPCTACVDGEYVSVPCGQTSDTTCSPCTVCGEAYYVSGNCSGMQDTQCSRISCGAPNALGNGTITGNNFTVGGTVVFTCSDGFLLTGSAAATCTLAGAWDAPTPTCVDASSAGAGRLQNSQNVVAPPAAGHDYSVFIGLAMALMVGFLIGFFMVFYVVLRDRRERMIREREGHKAVNTSMSNSGINLLPIGLTMPSPLAKPSPDMDLSVVDVDDPPTPPSPMGASAPTQWRTGGAGDGSPRLSRQESSKMGAATLNGAGDSLVRNNSSTATRGKGGLSGAKSKTGKKAAGLARSGSGTGGNNGKFGSSGPLAMSSPARPSGAAPGGAVASPSGAGLNASVMSATDVSMGGLNDSQLSVQDMDGDDALNASSTSEATPALRKFRWKPNAKPDAKPQLTRNFSDKIDAQSWMPSVREGKAPSVRPDSFVAQRKEIPLVRRLPPPLPTGPPRPVVVALPVVPKGLSPADARRMAAMPTVPRAPGGPAPIPLPEMPALPRPGPNRSPPLPIPPTAAAAETPSSPAPAPAPAPTSPSVASIADGELKREGSSKLLPKAPSIILPGAPRPAPPQ